MSPPDSPRIVVTSFGSSGDFNPVLAVAWQLRALGADVTFVANPFYAPAIEKAGLRFRPAGDHVDVFRLLEAEPRYLHPLRGGSLVWSEIVLPSIRATYPAVAAAIREQRAQAVAAHVLSFGGLWAAEQERVPSVTLTTTPFAWLSRHSPGTFADWTAPRWLQSLLVGAVRAGMGALLGGSLRRLARELGRPDGKDLFFGSAQASALNLGLWSPLWRGPTEHDPPRSRTCGFPHSPRTEPPPVEPDAATRFLDDGPPPVVVGLGSAAILHADALFTALAEASRRVGHRCLLIGARPERAPSGPDLCAVPFARYDQVFPRAAAIVHHGGTGTCGEALRSGKVSVITPFAFDQFDTAARAEKAQVAVRVRKKARSVEALAQALSRALNDPTLRARASDLAEALRREPDGARVAAELVMMSAASTFFDAGSRRG